MSNFNSFQYLKRGPSATPTSSFARPVRPFAPLPSHSSQSAPVDLQRSLERAERFGHSFERISLLPPVAAASDASIQEAVHSGGKSTEVSNGELTLQRNAASPAPVEKDRLGANIRAARSGGHPLNVSTQRTLEQGLGADLSAVRVHADAKADRLARSVNAAAFTTGADIFFRSGMYTPGSSQGLRLLAHEATHVVQQATGPVAGTPVQVGVSISAPGDSFERAAESSAARVMAGAASKRLGDLSFQRMTTGRKEGSVQTTSAESVRVLPVLHRTAANIAGRKFGSLHATSGERVYIQRYLFEVDGKQLTYSDTLVDEQGRERRGTRYAADQAPNLKFKLSTFLYPEQRNKPQSKQIFIDDPFNAAQMKGYLKDTIKESPQVIDIGRNIMDELDKEKAAGPFMLGVMKTIDGEVRVATSGGTSGKVGDAVKMLNGIYGRFQAAEGKQNQGEVITPYDHLALDDPRNPRAEINVVGKEQIGGQFDKYISKKGQRKREGQEDPHKQHHQQLIEAQLAGLRGKKRDRKRERLLQKLGPEPGSEHVIVEHLNCAAPQLLASAVGKNPPDLGKLNVRHLTEIWWDPKGESPVMIDGVRYHHRQRVPSCHRCENNLKIVVYKALRDAIRNELETERPSLSSAEASNPKSTYGKELRDQRAKEGMLKDNRYIELVESKIGNAEDILNARSTQDLATRYVTVLIENARNWVATAIYNRVITPQEFPQLTKETYHKTIRDCINGLQEERRNRTDPSRDLIMRALKELQAALSVG